MKRFHDCRFKISLRSSKTWGSSSSFFMSYEKIGSGVSSRFFEMKDMNNHRCLKKSCNLGRKRVFEKIHFSGRHYTAIV